MAKRRAKAAKKKRPLTSKQLDARPGRRGARNAVAADHQVDALELRKLGYSFTAIGAKIGVSRQAAHQQVHKALAELAEESRDKALELRELEVARIDSVLVGVMPRAQLGDEDAVRSFIRLSQRRALLLGLDLGRTLQGKGSLAPGANGELSFTFEVMGPAPAADEKAAEPAK